MFELELCLDGEQTVNTEVRGASALELKPSRPPGMGGRSTM